MERIETFSKAIVTFHNSIFPELAVSNFDEIPYERLRVFVLYSAEELFRPMVCELLRKGKSIRAVARITGMTPARVRGIGRKINVLC